jgi:hypothetical protein
MSSCECVTEVLLPLVCPLLLLLLLLLVLLLLQ